MISPWLLMTAAFATAVALATQLSVWRTADETGRPAGGLLAQILGESRRLVANHSLAKADIYLHSGVYPSIFDGPQLRHESHLASAASAGSSSHQHEHATGLEEEVTHGAAAHEDPDPVGPPRDWLEAFGRNFYPTRHTHLSEAQQKEMLPWLRLAAELNPNQVETYTIGAYWLRSRMGKDKEAEEFLREGWRANPDSYEILFELGRLFEENHRDPGRARNLYEAALRKWQGLELRKPEPNNFALMEISGHLAHLEEEAGRLGRAVDYLEILRKVSPRPEAVQAQIEQLKSRAHRLQGESPASDSTPL